MHCLSFQKNALGEVLFSKVVENLDIVDKEYFGLRFVNTNASSIVSCQELSFIRHQCIQMYQKTLIKLCLSRYFVSMCKEKFKTAFT